MNATKSLANTFCIDIEREVGNHAGKLLEGMEGRIMAPWNHPIKFRFPNSDRATDTFQCFIGIYDKVSAPAAILWPMRSSSGLATSPAQRRYMAVEVKLITGIRYGYCDPGAGKAFTWLLPTDARFDEIKRCISMHRLEEV